MAWVDKKLTGVSKFLLFQYDAAFAESRFTSSNASIAKDSATYLNDRAVRITSLTSSSADGYRLAKSSDLTYRTNSSPFEHAPFVRVPYTRYRLQARAFVDTVAASKIPTDPGLIVGATLFTGTLNPAVNNKGFETIKYPGNYDGRVNIKTNPTRNSWLILSSEILYSTASGSDIGVGLFFKGELNFTGNAHVTFDAIQVFQLDPISVSITVLNDASHMGATDGAARVNIAAPNEYLGNYSLMRMWDGAVVKTSIASTGGYFDLIGLRPGIYTIRVGDPYTSQLTGEIYEDALAGGYAGEYTFTIGPEGCTVIATATPVNATAPYASDGSITVAPGFGASPYQYSIDNGPYTSGLSASSYTFYNLPAKTYTIKVKDAGGCIYTINNVLVSAPPCTLAATVTKTDVSEAELSDGSATVLVTSGQSPYKYKIDNGVYQSEGVFNNLSAKTYTIKIKDAYGCEITKTITIDGPSPYNNFYGVQYTSQVHVVFNHFPSNMKIWEHFSEESDLIWPASSIVNENGQESELIEADFVELEDVYYADFLKDKNSPNIDSPEVPLIHGDDMLSTALVVKLSNDATTYTRLRAVNAGFLVSRGHKV